MVTNLIRFNNLKYFSQIFLNSTNTLLKERENDAGSHKEEYEET
jgi:hypothetical protein